MAGDAIDSSDSDSEGSEGPVVRHSYAKLKLQIGSPAPVVHIVVDPAEIFLPADGNFEHYKLHDGLAQVLDTYGDQDIVWHVLERDVGVAASGLPYELADFAGWLQQYPTLQHSRVKLTEKGFVPTTDKKPLPPAQTIVLSTDSAFLKMLGDDFPVGTCSLLPLGALTSVHDVQTAEHDGLPYLFEPSVVISDFDGTCYGDVEALQLQAVLFALDAELREFEREFERELEREAARERLQPIVDFMNRLVKEGGKHYDRDRVQELLASVTQDTAKAKAEEIIDSLLGEEIDLSTREYVKREFWLRIIKKFLDYRKPELTGQQRMLREFFAWTKQGDKSLRVVNEELNALRRSYCDILHYFSGPAERAWLYHEIYRRLPASSQQYLTPPSAAGKKVAVPDDVKAMLLGTDGRAGLLQQMIDCTQTLEAAWTKDASNHHLLREWQAHGVTEVTIMTTRLLDPCFFFNTPEGMLGFVKVAQEQYGITVHIDEASCIGVMKKPVYTTDEYYERGAPKKAIEILKRMRAKHKAGEELPSRIVFFDNNLAGECQPAVQLVQAFAKLGIELVVMHSCDSFSYQYTSGHLPALAGCLPSEKLRTEMWFLLEGARSMRSKAPGTPSALTDDLSTPGAEESGEFDVMKEPRASGIPAPQPRRDITAGIACLLAQGSSGLYKVGVSPKSVSDQDKVLEQTLSLRT